MSILSARSFLLAALVALPKLAHADTVFYFSGGSSTLSASGTFSMDLSTGEISAVDITVAATQPGSASGSGGAGASKVNLFSLDEVQTTPVDRTGIGNSPYYAIFGDSSVSGVTLELLLPGTYPLLGYAGGPICSLANPCTQVNLADPDSDGTVYSTFTGSSTDSGSSGAGAGKLDVFAYGQVSQTPEPSGLLLLATGMAGAAGVARRRIVGA